MAGVIHMFMRGPSRSADYNLLPSYLFKQKYTIGVDYLGAIF